MPVQFDNFDQTKVDHIKNHLVAQAKKNQAKFYEIFVDSLRAVQKTDEPNEFENYEDYLTPDTAQIKIVIYNSAASPRNDQYFFYLKAQNRDEAMEIGLNGTPNKTFSFSDISEWRLKNGKKSAELMEIKRLKGIVNELNGQIQEKEEQIEKFADAIFLAKQNGNKLGGIHLGDILSVALEGAVRRNTHLIKQVPFLGELAGIIEDDNKKGPLLLQAPESEVTIKRREQSTTAPALSDQDKSLLGLIKEIQHRFKENDFEQIIEILELLGRNKSQIATVVDLLKEDEPEQEEENEN